MAENDTIEPQADTEPTTTDEVDPEVTEMGAPASAVKAVEDLIKSKTQPQTQEELVAEMAEVEAKANSEVSPESDTNTEQTLDEGEDTGNNEDEDVDATEDEESEVEPSEPEVVAEELLQRAESDAGLTRDEARALGSDGLESLLTTIDKRVASVQAAAPAPKDESLPLVALELDEELELEPAFAEALGGFRDSVQAGLEALNARLDVIEAVEDQRVKASESKALNAAMSQLGDEWADTLGKGKLTREQTKNRGRIMDEVELLKAGCERLGRKVPNPTELVTRAANSLFAAQQAERVRAGIAKKTTKRSGQTISRTSPKKQKGTPAERARQAAERVWAEKGFG